MLNELAGKPAPKEILINPEQLQRDYYEKRPDLNNAIQKVRFGTSGHRGTPLNGSFTEFHIRAIVQAIADYRKKMGYSGPLFLGKDPRITSDLAQKTTIEVLAGNNIPVIFQENNDFTPTPVISHLILNYNRQNNPDAKEIGENNGRSVWADGIIITASHNPPTDGGIKYNPPNGGAADTNVSKWIENRANEILQNNNIDVHFCPFDNAIQQSNIVAKDLSIDYIDDLTNVIDFDVIRKANLKIGVDPLGGAAVHYWDKIAQKYGLNLTVVNDKVDPTFSFMSVDWDGKIRMDCSSPFAMAKLVGLKDQFDIALANDPDADRHGIITKSVGLLNSNHYLSVAIDYLIKNRPLWQNSAGIGKTLVSSSMIDRVVADLGRQLVEVPVGFKWFVPGLLSGKIAFGGEESAGASFLKMDGSTWTTDKDGIILDLLAVEILARTGKDPGILYQELEKKFGSPLYQRISQPATIEQKEAFKNLTPDKVKAQELANEPILQRLTNAPGNNAPIGGLKVVTQNGWFAARPSGTENIYKIYAESFSGEKHLDAILKDASTVVSEALE